MGGVGSSGRVGGVSERTQSSGEAGLGIHWAVWGR